MNPNFSRSALCIGIAGAIAFSGAGMGSANAQTATSPKIVITNLSPNVELPLGTASTVEIDANGDMRMQCRLDASGKCPGIGTSNDSGGTGTNPPTNVTLTRSAANIVTGQSVTLTWGSGTGTEACYGAGPTGMSNWTGSVLTSSGSRAVTINTVGTYTFQVRCFNSTGSTTVSSLSVGVTQATTPPPPPPEADYCTEVYGSNMPTSPNFTAFGFQRIEVPFAEIWGVSPGVVAPSKGVPGIFTNPSQGRYMAVPFTMTSDSGDNLSQVRMSWVEVQPSFSEPSLNITTGKISFTISPCPGDFRPRVNGSPDPFLSGACRISAASISGNMNISTVAGLAGCRVAKGKKAYINIAAYDMFGTSAPAAMTCNVGQTTCGVSMRLP